MRIVVVDAQTGQMEMRYTVRGGKETLNLTGNWKDKINGERQVNTKNEFGSDPENERKNVPCSGEIEK